MSVHNTYSHGKAATSTLPLAAHTQSTHTRARYAWLARPAGLPHVACMPKPPAAVLAMAAFAPRHYPAPGPTYSF